MLKWQSILGERRDKRTRGSRSQLADKLRQYIRPIMTIYAYVNA